MSAGAGRIEKEMYLSQFYVLKSRYPCPAKALNYVVAYLNKVNVQRNKFNLISIDVWH